MSIMRSSFRLMGLDVGQRWVGIALSDEKQKIAFPFLILDKKSPDFWNRLEGIIAEKNIKGIIVGIPIKEDGKQGRQVRFVKSFISQLREKTQVKIETFDERYTSIIAEKLSREFKKKKRKARKDHISASIILSDYLATKMQKNYI